MSRERARRWCVAIALAYWFALSVSSVVNWARPGSSYDMVPYLGLVAAEDVNDDEQVRAAAYHELREVADPEEWRNLTGQNAYVRQMRADPALFSRDLGYYRIKWGYIGPARLLSQWMEPYSALRLINLMATLLFLGLLLFLLWSSKVVQGTLLIGPVLMAGLLEYVIRSTTPDMLALAMTALLLTGWLRRSTFLFAAASAFAVAVRPDMLFLICGIFGAALLFGARRGAAGLALALSLLVFAAARLSTPYPGWWQHVSAALYGPSAVIGGAPDLSLASYVTSWLMQFAKIAATGTYLHVMLLLLVTYLGLSRRASAAVRHQDVIFYGALIGLAARMLLFPSIEARLFLPTLFILTMLTIIRLRPDFSKGLAFASAVVQRRFASWRVSDVHEPGT